MSVAVSPSAGSGSYDYAKRRRAKRSGREKGCWVYIAADELRSADIDPDDPAPWYRVWSSPRGAIRMRLYKKG